MHNVICRCQPAARENRGLCRRILFTIAAVMPAESVARAALIVMLFVALSTVNARAGVILSDSFESPVVSGIQVPTAPDGWMRTTGTWDGRSGLANTDTGVFTTPYGDQAACTWREGQSALTTEDSTWSEGLWTGITYSVTFNVAKASINDADYKVELIALDPGEFRGWDDSGTVLASASGTATNTNMSQTDSFNYTAPTNSPHLGKLLALQLEGGWDAETVLVDNLILSSTAVGDASPPALAVAWPTPGATWVSIDTTLEATFNEDVTIGSGNIEIRRTSDDTLFEAIAIDSGQVSQSGRTLTITPASALEHGVEYYILFDSGTLHDTAGNAFEVTSPSLWRFTTGQPAGIRELFYESFEDPVVSGMGPQPSFPTNGWVKGSHNSWVQLYNEDTGDFSTPYGDQAFMITYGNYAFIVTDSNTVNDVYQEGVTYTLTFNVAVTNSSIERAYDVRLMYIPEGIQRTSYNNGGTVVASVTGKALYSDMREGAGIVFTVPEGATYIGKPIDIRINWSSGYCLIDNLKLSNDVAPAGTVLIIK